MSTFVDPAIGVIRIQPSEPEPRQPETLLAEDDPSGYAEAIQVETNSGAPRKLPVLRRHFHLLPFFDEGRNANLQTGLQLSYLGSATARGVAARPRFRIRNAQLNKHRQLQTDRIAVVLVQLDQRALNQKVQRIPYHPIVESERLVALLIQKVRTIAVAIQIGGWN
jgi:hypothetical protein